jgi:PAS domain S-box-containing protein
MKRILVVEDETEVAAFIKTSLNKIGYEVVSVESQGEEAVRRTGETLPDLVLMDIVLDGHTSGIEAAQTIRDGFDIPVVYLTGHSDESILESAKATRPFGYLLKPFNISELRAVIEIAVHKHKQEKKARQRTKLLDLTLKSIANAVITTDTNASVTFMNPAAENLIGWKQKEVLGKDLNEVLNLKDEKLLNSIKREVTESLTSGVENDSYNDTACNPEETEENFSRVISPIKDEKGDIAGAVLIFGSASQRKRINKRDHIPQKREHEAHDILPINLALASSSPLIRSGVRKILDHEDDIEIISEASSINELLRLIDKKIHDVLFLDTSIPGLDVEMIRQAVIENKNDARILLLLHNTDEDLIINALYSGVQGFVKANSLPSELVGAVRSVYKNEIWLERNTFRTILNRVLGSNHNMPGLLKTGLTAREKEIVELVAQGNSNKQISQKLSISRNTVKNHLANIFSKLGITNRLQIGTKISF